MPADVFRTDDHYLVQVDLPGIVPESLEVTADDRTLAVSAERTPPVDGDQQQGQVLVAERRYGRFFRQISLPAEADLDHRGLPRRGADRPRACGGLGLVPAGSR